MVSSKLERKKKKIDIFVQLYLFIDIQMSRLLEFEYAGVDN